MSTMRVTNLKHENSASNNIVLNSDGSVGGELATTLASKVDYALPTNAQTGTTYTFVAADAEKLTTASNASPVTLTIPPASSVAWPDNTVLRVVNYGAGAVTIDGGSGVTVTNTATTVAQYGAAVAIRTGSDAWTVVPFGGGDIPAAEVSSPSATGQYSSGGFTYDYYTFTSSGTLTIGTGGMADILLVGGGGAGGYNAGGGGGAGGMVVATDVYLPAGNLTVSIGAGGGASGSGGPTRLGYYYSPGGGRGGQGNGAYGSENGSRGGSGGGGGSYNGAVTTGGAGGSGIGNGGGNATSSAGNFAAGGGGGAGGSGASATGSTGGAGGAGLANSYTGSSVTYAAGGTGKATANGAANTGNGGGGNVGTGGSGIVVVRVKV